MTTALADVTHGKQNACAESRPPKTHCGAQASAPVSVTFRDTNDRRVTKSLARKQRPAGTGLSYSFEAKRLKSGIAYVRWSVFFNDAVEVRDTRQSIISGKDVVVERAIRYLVSGR